MRGTGCRRRFEVGALRQRSRAEVGTGCPSFGGQRTVASSRRECAAPVQAPARSRSKNQTTRLLLCCKAKRASPFSRYQSTGAVRASVGQLALQRWYASPPEYEARLRLRERGLTLPSSGLAFGQPLKSNVRRLRCTKAYERSLLRYAGNHPRMWSTYCQFCTTQLRAPPLRLWGILCKACRLDSRRYIRTEFEQHLAGERSACAGRLPRSAGIHVSRERIAYLLSSASYGR